MSYLSMWWKTATPDRKVKMKTLVDNGQLEMVTAGWVMNDEANTHYFAMIDQMIEGKSRLRSLFSRIGFQLPSNCEYLVYYIFVHFRFVFICNYFFYVSYWQKCIC